MSNPKELNFFVERPDGSWHRGLGWYASHFDARLPVRGDTSPAYANAPRSAGTAERMASVLPDARLIYMVRDPLARAVSNWVHATAVGFEAAPLEQALAEPGSRYVARSLYATQLREFLRCFPLERILVVDHAELGRERGETLGAIFGSWSRRRLRGPALRAGVGGVERQGSPLRADLPPLAPVRPWRLVAPVRRRPLVDRADALPAGQAGAPAARGVARAREPAARALRGRGRGAPDADGKALRELAGLTLGSSAPLSFAETMSPRRMPHPSTFPRACA